MTDAVTDTQSDDADDFVLEDFLPYQLAILSSRISDGFSLCYRKKFGLSVSEWRVIAHLMRADKVSIREIYNRVAMDKSKVSRAAARLEQAGYIQKQGCARDRRLVELSLTPKGRAVAREIGPMGLKYARDILRNLPEEARAPFLGAIRTLLEVYE